VAELCAVGLGAFVAAGLARSRERAAGLAAGITITFGFGLFWSLVLFFSITVPNFDPSAILVPAPWYQNAIDGLVAVAAPFVGLYMSGWARLLNEEMSVGFAGINRLHFLWLWLAVHWYAIALISAFAELKPSASQLIVGLLTGVSSPAVFMISGYYGLALLSGSVGGRLSSIRRNVLGILLLSVGFLAGVAFQELLSLW
jgi:hypothetical protein